VSDNKIESIVTNNILSTVFKGIYCIPANVAMTGNRLGNFNAPNDLSIAGVGVHCGMLVSSTGSAIMERG